MKNNDLTAVESAKKLVESIRNLPVLQNLPGFPELEKKLVDLDIIEERAVEEEPKDDIILVPESEISPILWMGLFMVPDPEDDEGLIEIPLSYKSGTGGLAMTYTEKLENIPSLITMCKSIAVATGFEWRMVEYRGKSEYDTAAFGVPGTKTSQ